MREEVWLHHRLCRIPGSGVREGRQAFASVLLQAWAGDCGFEMEGMKEREDHLPDSQTTVAGVFPDGVLAA